MQQGRSRIIQTHHLLLVKETSSELAAFQKELEQPEHFALVELAKKGSDFAESMAIIGLHLGIDLDGWHDPEELFKLFLRKLRQKRGLIA